MKSTPQIDRILTVVVLALLIGGCFLVLRPFLTAIIWAAILCATIWPLFLRLRNAFKGRAGWAATVIVLLMSVTVVVPFIIVGITIADNADFVGEYAQELIKAGPPGPPAWVAGLPVIGAWAAETWGTFAHDTARLFDAARELIEPLKHVLFAGGSLLLGGVLQLILSLFIAFFFLRDGDTIVTRLHAGIDRIAGDRGRRLALVAATTVRGVVLRHPGYGDCARRADGDRPLDRRLQGGAPARTRDLLPVAGADRSAARMDPRGADPAERRADELGDLHIRWGALVVSSVDNFLKPMIISRGSDLPFILVLLGVLGGVVAFGFVGVFLGPVLARASATR